MTRKSLDAARCTGEPLLVIARNRVFLCILHCCMAFGRTALGAMGTIGPGPDFEVCAFIICS